MVVEAVIGLGEAAVSGAVTPDHYILKRDGSVRKAKVHEQPYAIVADEAGGVAERELSPTRAERARRAMSCWPSWPASARTSSSGSGAAGHRVGRRRTASSTCSRRGR